jgi:hypothetical protein
MANLILTVVSASCSLALLTVYVVTILTFGKQNALLRELAGEAARVVRACTAALDYLKDREDALDAKRDAVTQLQQEGFTALDAALKIVNAHSSTVMRAHASAATAGDERASEIAANKAEPIVERTVGG